MADPYVYLAASVIEDTSNNTNDATSADISITADTTKPTLSSSAFDENTGVLTLTFSETVRNDGATTNGAVDIRDGAGASHGTGSVRITADPAITGAVATYVALTEANRQKVISMTDPHVYLAASVIEDSSDNTNDALSAGSDAAITADATNPSLSSARIHEGTGAWTVTFTETVSAGTASNPLYVAESGSTSYTSTSDVLLAVPSSDVSSSGMLSEADRQKVISLTDPYVFVAASGVKDTSDNNAAAGSLDASVTGDTTAPQISSTAPTLAEGTGILVITFDETVKAGSDVDLTKILMRDGSGTMDGIPLGATQQVPALGDATTTSTGNNVAVTITLNEAQRQAAIGYADPHVYFMVGAVKDTSDQDLDNSASTRVTDTPDSIDPTFTGSSTTPTLDENAGTVTMSFSETISPQLSHIDPTKITIVDGNDSSQTLTLDTNQRCTPDGTALTCYLTEPQRISVLRLDPQSVKLDTGAVQDTSENDVTAATHAADVADDTTAPPIRSITMDLGADPSVSITFGEAIDSITSSSLSVVSKSDSSDSWSLSSAATMHSRNRLAVIPLVETEREAISGFGTSLELRAAAGAWQDAAGNNNLQLSTDIDRRLIGLDTRPPTLLSASINLASKTASFTFDETVDASEFDPNRFVVTTNTGAYGTDLSGVPAADGKQISISLTGNEAGRILFASESSLPVNTVKVSASSGAWKDLSGNSNGEVSLSAVPVSAPSAAGAPNLVWSKLDLSGRPVLELYFDQAIDLANFDHTKLQITDPVGANRVDLPSAPSTRHSTNNLASDQRPSSAPSAVSKVVLPLTLANKITVHPYASNSWLTIDGGAWQGATGVANAAFSSFVSVRQSIPDSTGPTVSSVTVLGTQSPGPRLVLTFSEPISAGSLPTQYQHGQSLRLGASPYAREQPVGTTVNSYLQPTNFLTRAAADAAGSGTCVTRELQGNGTTIYRRFCGGNTISTTASSFAVVPPKSYSTTSGYVNSVFLHLSNSQLSEYESRIANPLDNKVAPGESPYPPRLIIQDGTISDAVGNTVSATVDSPRAGTGPRLINQSIDLSNNSLSLTFDNLVSTLDSTKIYVGGPSSTSKTSLDGGTSLSGTATATGTSTPLSGNGSASVSIPLTAAQSTQLAALEGSPHWPLRLFADADAWDAATGNGGNAVSGAPLPATAGSADTTPPSISSASLDLSADPAVLEITFDEVVDVSEFQSYNLYISTSQGSASGVALFRTPTTATDGTSVEVPLTTQQKLDALAQGSSNRYVVVLAGAWRDLSGNALASQASAPLTVTPDSTPPTNTASLNLRDGLLTISFDEAVDPTSFAPSSVAFGFAGVTPGSFTLTGSSLRPSLDTYPLSLTLDLSEAERVQAIESRADPSHTATSVRLAGGSDLSGNSIQFASYQLQSSDVTADDEVPLLLSSTLDLTSKELSLAFDETVDVSALDLTKFHFSNIGETTEEPLSGGSLGDATAPQDDGATVVLTIPDDLAAFAGSLRVPHVDIDAGAYRDVAGNQNAQNHDNDMLVVTDTTPPTLDSAALDAHSGLLTLTFSDTVSAAPAYNVDLSRIYLSSPNTSDEHALTGSSVLNESNSSEIRIRLSEQLRRAAIDGSSELDVQRGAFVDPFRNALPASADVAVSVTPDTTKPTLVSASLNANTGKMVLSFDEPVRHLSLSSVSVSTLTSSAPLAGSSADPGPAESLTITLSEADLQAVAALSGARDVALLAGAVRDYAGQTSDARPADPASPLLSYIPDSTAPSLQRAVLNLDARTLRLVFDEPVRVQDLSKISLNAAGPADGQDNALTGAAWQAPSLLSSTLEISAIPQATVTALVNLGADVRLNLQADAIRDASANPAAEVLDAAVLISADSTAPSLQSASLDESSGRLDLVFDEPVSEPLPALVSVAGSAVSGEASVSGNTASILLDADARAAAIEARDRAGAETVQVSLREGAVSDLSANPVAAVTVQASVVQDSTPPALESASLDLGIGELVLEFDEPVTTGYLFGITIGTRGLDGDSNVSGDRTARLEITLSEAGRQDAIAGPSPVTVQVSGPAVSDFSGNEASGSLSVEPSRDSLAPSVSQARLNTETGVIRILLDEWAAGAIDTSRIVVQGPQVQVSLALSSVETDAEVVRISLDPSELERITSTDGLRLSIVDGAGITDTSGNPLADSTPQLGIDDPVPPQLLSARITGPSTVLLIFSEDLQDSTVTPLAFHVGTLETIGAREISPGRVLLTVQGLPEGVPQRVGAASTVRDNSDNPLQQPSSVQASWLPARIQVLSLEMTSDGADARLAKAGDTITVSLSTATDVSTMSSADVLVAGSRVEASVSDGGFTASYLVGADPDGPVSLSARVTNEAGFSTVLTEQDLTGPQVTIDATPPSIKTARFAGTGSVLLVFSEPVLTTADDYDVEVDGVRVIPFVYGSGTTTVLLVWAGLAADPATSSAAITVGASLTDLAGNSGAATTTASGAQTEISVEPLRIGRTLETASGPAVVTPVPLSETIALVTFAPSPFSAIALDLSSLTSVDAFRAELLCALVDDIDCLVGDDAALWPGSVTVVTGQELVTRLVLPRDLEVAGLSPDKLVHVYEAEQRRVQEALDDENFAGDSEVGGFDIASARVAELGSASRDIAFSSLVRVQFDPSVLYDGTLVFSVDSAGNAKRLSSCGADPAAALAALGASDTVDRFACVDYETSSVWTRHFTAFGVAPAFSGGSECDDCTAPTLGYDSSGARLVSEGFSYNGLASDVQHFFTPYPLITSEVGDENTISLKIYENSGPSNIEHVAVAFGLRSGQVISESLAVINYDIRHDGTGSVSVIDPLNSLDPPSASHEVVECSADSELQCLSVTINHSFRSPLEFDIVGTDVWDRERNSWQNYFNHGIRVTGETLNPVPGVRVNGGELILHPIVEGSNNIDVMADEDHNLYRLSPDGLYKPLRNVSALFHEIDESMYRPDGEPMQGYDRRDAEFAAVVDEQIDLARAILAEMNLGRQSWDLAEAESSVHVVLDRLESLRGDIEAERERAELRHAQLYAPTERPE